MLPNRNRCIVIAGAMGTLAIVLGAFGAHALEDRLSPKMMDVYQTGVLYHLIHAVALLSLAFASDSIWTCKWASRIATTWLAGTLLFSGSLYILAVTGIGPLGAITPFGGVALIAGWIMVTFLRNQQN